MASLKHLAVVVLGQLIHYVPTLINLQHVESFLEGMWGSLHDPSTSLRLATVDVLKWSLRFVKDRSDSGPTFFAKIYSTAKTSINPVRLTFNPSHLAANLLLFRRNRLRPSTALSW